MDIDIYRDDFTLKPHFYKGKGFNKEFYGYSKAYVLNFLWFEIVILI